MIRYIRPTNFQIKIRGVSLPSSFLHFVGKYVKFNVASIPS